LDFCDRGVDAPQKYRQFLVAVLKPFRQILIIFRKKSRPLQRRRLLFAFDEPDLRSELATRAIFLDLSGFTGTIQAPTLYFNSTMGSDLGLKQTSLLPLIQWRCVDLQVPVALGARARRTAEPRF
jgi:hypothetical protein